MPCRSASSRALHEPIRTVLASCFWKLPIGHLHVERCGRAINLDVSSTFVAVAVFEYEWNHFCRSSIWRGFVGDGAALNNGAKISLHARLPVDSATHRCSRFIAYRNIEYH